MMFDVLLAEVKANAHTVEAHVISMCAEEPLENAALLHRPVGGLERQPISKHFRHVSLVPDILAAVVFPGRVMDQQPELM